jgi:hypothetical protein
MHLFIDKSFVSFVKRFVPFVLNEFDRSFFLQCDNLNELN